MSTPLLQVKNLCTSFDVDAGEVRAVNGISFSLDKGRVLGIVGAFWWSPAASRAAKSSLTVRTS